MRVAVAALFALDGFVMGSWAARVPDVSAGLGAGHAALGGALLCLSLGALACMQVTGALCSRVGAGLVASVAAVLVCATTVLPGLAGSMPALCAALLVFGGATGMLNVAANSIGVQVEARAGRPLLSGMHAAFSLGGLGGALAGALASAVLGVAVHLVVVAAACLLLTAWAAPALVGGDTEAPSPARRTATTRAGRPTAVLVVLGVIAGCTAFGEGGVTDWAALYLREDLAAGPALAAAGYAGFSLAMACGRLAGDRLVRRLGERQVLVGGALLAAAGGSAAVLTSSLPVALAGFVLVGLGLANVFPLSIARAGALGGAGGVALSTTIGYTGLLGGPPLIGFLAAHAGLAVALGVVAVLAVLVAGLVLTLQDDGLRLPVLPSVLLPSSLLGTSALTATSAGMSRLVTGARGSTGTYVRDLRLLAVS
ncbi:MFS transporter [Modestobacter sp. I12A-02628]|uniref:MFS transporter n=1 Tax=Goekera deserti TaxID=2497753 RepID=A0A7K3WIV5_9ACTN|nr:MFS transporter [Goekera deserti]NDI47005.1 MFS transporter [Goekera deserti]NEL56242.1 MFS transporter [Goekera deserti]